MKSINKYKEYLFILFYIDNLINHVFNNKIIFDN